MKRFKEIITIKTINQDTGEETTEEKERIYTAKNWNELSTEEKEKEIKNNSELIYQEYQDQLYYNFKDEIEEIKEKYNNISFDDVYFDSCSQGSSIDTIKGLKWYYNIDIYGENVEVFDIDLHIRKYIDKITENNIYYYMDNEKIKDTKKFKKFIDNIIKEVNNFIDDINSSCKVLIDNEYCAPYDLNDPEDVEFLDNYFCDNEFIFEEV